MCETEKIMTNDADWVEDVKRWYFSSAGSAAQSAVIGTAFGISDYGMDLGYEAAHPALQARNWPDAAAFTTDR